MNMLSTVMNIISALLSVYMILIIISIFLTWFRGNINSRALQILTSIVNPYLNFFRKITWLRVGNMDFSPIVGIMILGLFVQITSTIAQTGQFTAMHLVSYIIYSIWSIVSFVLDILVIAMVVRFVSTFFVKKSSQLWFTMDNILNKVMAKILGIFTSKPVPFKKALVICAVILLAFRLGLGYALNYILAFLSNI